MFHNQYVQLIPFRAFQIPLCVQSRALGFFSFMKSWRRLSFKSLRNPSFESSPQTLFTLQWSLFSSSDDSKDIVDFVSIQKSDLSPPSPIRPCFRGGEVTFLFRCASISIETSSLTGAHPSNARPVISACSKVSHRQNSEFRRKAWFCSYPPAAEGIWVLPPAGVR